MEFDYRAWEKVTRVICGVSAFTVILLLKAAEGGGGGVAGGNIILFK